MTRNTKYQRLENETRFFHEKDSLTIYYIKSHIFAIYRLISR